MGQAALKAGAGALAMLVAAPSTAAPPPPPQRPIVIIGSAGPNMLGTATVPIRADRFSSSRAQALQDASHLPAMQQLIAPARKMSRLQQIAYVQRTVHGSIRWISDATEWGRHDYWASAAQTLGKRAGDMEDRAIVKLQALRTLGFDSKDLFITLGRDRVGGPVTLVTVRADGRYVILDDTGGTPFSADSRRNELQPFLSFGWSGTWVHTRAAPAVPVAAAASASARK